MLKTKETNHIPTLFRELETNISMFGNLIDVIMGPHHRVSQEYGCFWHKFQLLYMQLHREFDQMQSFRPAHLLRHLQLELFHYFDAKRYEEELTTEISFVQILMDNERSAFVLPMSCQHLLLD